MLGRAVRSADVRRGVSFPAQRQRCLVASDLCAGCDAPSRGRAVRTTAVTDTGCERGQHDLCPVVATPVDRFGVPGLQRRPLGRGEASGREERESARRRVGTVPDTVVAAPEGFPEPAL